MTATPTTGTTARAIRPSASAGPSGAVATDGRAAGRGTVLLRAVRAELIKVVSVRSTAVALAVAAPLILALGVVTTIGAVTDGALPPEEGAPVLSPLDAPFGGITTALWAVAVLGVLVVTSEYSTGSIRTTLAAVPRRGTLVIAKAVAVVLTTLTVVVPTTVVTHLAGQLVLGAAGGAASLPPADAVRLVLGASLYLGVVALVGSGFGWLLRSTAGAVFAVFGLLVLLPVLATLLPAEVLAAIAPYLPDAGAAVYQSDPVTAPWAGLAVLTGYAAVLLAGGAAVLRRRDA
jgi:ABC-type transport system involved in multi-copper enzyme maturation permease subunit